MFKRGFTILELVAVLVIIGILSGLGAVTYSSLIAKSETEVAEKSAQARAREAYAMVAIDNNGVATVEAIADQVDGETGATDAVFAYDGSNWTVSFDANGAVQVAASA